MSRILAILVVALWPASARAGLTEQQIGAVALAPPPDARVAPDLVFRDTEGRRMTVSQALGGRATLLIPADYTCRETCGPALSIAAGALAETGLVAGRDYSLVVIGLDERAGPEIARNFAGGQIGGPGVSVLAGDTGAIRSLTDAIGYRFERDDGNGAVAHPAAYVTLTGDGRVSRALSSLALTSTDLRLALIDAGEGRVGGLLGRLALLCYGFDAVHGIYTARIEWLLRVCGALTVAALATGIGLLLRRGSRGAAA